MKHRILVLSELFSRGGLETHVSGQARVLSDLGVELLLATGSPASDCPPGIFDATLTNLKMGPQATFDDLSVTLERLQSFIKNEQITLIHAHPFYSTIVGFLVAQRSNLPFVATLHGPLALNAAFGELYDFLLKAVALPAASRVYCVSPEVDMLCRAATQCRTEVFPNAVEIPLLEQGSSAVDGPWLWAGRLDEDKSQGLIDLIEKVEPSEIGELHVFGGGPYAPTLASYLESKSDKAAFVRMKGWHDDLPTLFRTYAGVAGMGRVMLEAAALNKPCLLVGYDGVKGLLDARRFEQASFWNFSGRGMPTASAETLRADFQALSQERGRFELREQASASHDERSIWQRYLQQISSFPALNDPRARIVLEALQLRGTLHSPVWSDEALLQIIRGLVANVAASEVGVRRGSIEEIRAESDAAPGEASLRAELEKAKADNKVMLEEVTRTRADLELVRAQNATMQEKVAALRANLQRLQVETAAGEEAVAALRDMLEEAQRERDIALQEVNDLQYLTTALQSSASWRLTIPIRIGGTLVRKATRFGQRNVVRLAFLKNRMRTHGVIDTARWVRQRLLQDRNTTALTNHPASEIVNLFNSLPNSPKIAVVPCAFEFDELANQRPINLAKFLSRKGYFVVFVAWQWSPNEHLKKSGTIVHENVIQISLYQFLHNVRLFPKRSPKDGVFFVTFPAGAFLEPIRDLRSRGFSIVYDIMDDWEEFAGVDQAPWYERAIEDQIILEADVVCGVSKPLVDKFRHLRTDAFINGNGYSVDVLGKEAADIARITVKKQGIRAGYFGHLTDSWFDWDLLLKTAESNADIQFDVIGYGAPDHCLRAVERLPNVTYHGPVPPSQLSIHTRRWTVGLIPFKKGTLAAAVDPIKIYEYLYMGLPVVVTGIEHLAAYHCTKVADHPEEFSKFIREQSSLQAQWPRAAVDQFLAASTWHARFEALLAEIEASEPAGALYA